jgi:hypothetical protein
MIPGKDVRSYLFKLYENKLVKMHVRMLVVWVSCVVVMGSRHFRLQELCPKADFNSQSTQYTWLLDPESLLTEVKRVIAVTIVNLQVRAAEERVAALEGASWRGREDDAASRCCTDDVYCDVVMLVSFLFGYHRRQAACLAAVAQMEELLALNMYW